MGDDNVARGDYFTFSKEKNLEELKVKGGDFGFVDAACGTESVNRLLGSSSETYNHEDYADEADQCETTLGESTSNVTTTTTTTIDNCLKFFNVKPIRGSSAAPTAPKDGLTIPSRQYKKELDMNKFEEIVTNSVRMFYPMNSKTTNCGFLNQIKVLTAKPFDDCTAQDLQILDHFVRSILYTKRPGRKEKDTVGSNEKKGNYPHHTPILDLPSHHIRECWCNFLKKTLLDIPGMDRFGNVSYHIVLDDDFKERLGNDAIDEKGYIFLFAVTTASVALAKLLFNDRLQYHAVDANICISMPTWSDLQKEFVEMVRNSKKHRGYYEIHKVQLADKKRAYREEKKKAKRQKNSSEAQLNTGKEREAVDKKQSSSVSSKQEAS